MQKQKMLCPPPFLIGVRSMPPRHPDSTIKGAHMAFHGYWDEAGRPQAQMERGCVLRGCLGRSCKLTRKARSATFMHDRHGIPRILCRVLRLTMIRWEEVLWQSTGFIVTKSGNNEDCLELFCNSNNLLCLELAWSYWSQQQKGVLRTRERN